MLGVGAVGPQGSGALQVAAGFGQPARIGQRQRADLRGVEAHPDGWRALEIVLAALERWQEGAIDLVGNDLLVISKAAWDKLSPEQQQELDLPQTATGFLGSVLRGFAALAAGLGGLVALLRRPT